MKPMKEMMADAHNKVSEGPVGVAVRYLDECVQASVARGLFKTVPLWRSVAIAVDHIRCQREALLVAARAIQLLEEGDSKQSAAAIVEFKRHALRARLHQYVQPTKYPSLEESLRLPGEPDLKS